MASSFRKPQPAAGSRTGRLYDRYSEQVYNYCLRLTGSPDDAADATQDAFVNVLRRLQDDDRPVLDFASYLFAAARNESYALMRRRSRAHPSEEAPERASPEPDLDTDPERAVLLRDSQDAVRRANATLAPRHREVLALRDVAGRSYDQIGQIMGDLGERRRPADLAGRGKLKTALSRPELWPRSWPLRRTVSIAQLLISRAAGRRADRRDAEREWLDEHLDECGSCKAARGMLFEVAASYRAWAPVAVLAGAKTDMLTRAGEVVGADWSATHAGAGGGIPRSRASRTAAGGALTAAIVGALIAVAGLPGDDASTTRHTAPAGDGPSTGKSEASGSAKASKAAGSPAAAGSATSGLSPLTSAAAPGEQGGVLGVSEQSAGGPGSVGAPAPRRDRPGNPQEIAPEPRDGQPRGGPRTGSPGQPGDPGGGGPGPKDPPKDPPGKPDPPPVDEPPVIPPTGADCSWPGHGNGNGPGGCPPGHGGIPPGHGGTPPGQSKPAR